MTHEDRDHNLSGRHQEHAPSPHVSGEARLHADNAESGEAETTAEIIAEAATESTLENLEQAIADVERLSDEIEVKGEQAIAEASSPALAAKHEKILEKLEKENESFLKKVSKALAAYSKEVVGSFRDKSIVRQAEKASERMDRNKDLASYTNANNLSKASLHVKAEKAFLSSYEKAQALLLAIEGKEWGASKHADQAITRVNLLLNRFASHGASLGREDEAFRMLSIYEEQDRLRAHMSSGFSGIAEAIFKKTEKDGEGQNWTVEEMEASFRHDPFVFCEAIHREFDPSDADRGGIALVEKYMDMLIEMYPEGGEFTKNATKLLGLAFCQKKRGTTSLSKKSETSVIFFRRSSERFRQKR
jgi:hypothetical protein